MVWYYYALEQADNQANSTPFIHFMLSVIQQTLAQNALANTPENAPANLTGLKTPEAILVLLSSTPELTRQQLADTLNKDVRTIGRAISKLQKEGRLTRIGSDKTGHWQVQ